MTKAITSIGDLTPDESNANLGTERGRYMLEQSLRESGAGRSIVVDAQGRVIGGNKVLEIVEELGLPIEVVQSDGHKLVVVQRTDLDLETDQRARRLAYFDNRTAEISLTWNAEQLVADLDTGLDLGDMWQDFELQELLEGVDGWGDEPPEDPGPQIDKAAELQEKWQTERGQAWQIGKHKIMCGDSTSAEDVARLMGGEKAAFAFTDPPYGVKYTGGTKKWAMLENDDEINMYAAVLPQIREFTESKAALYLAFADANARSVYNSLSDNGYIQRALLIWNKNHAQFGAMGSQYKQKHEPIAYCFKAKQSPYWFGPNNEVTVWDIDRAAANEFHPTQKPVELVVRAMNNSAPNGALTLDLFLGSGTTMVAAEQTGRVCYGMEIEPKYCAVTLERMDGFGLEPVLI